jgi:predicted nucleic acid-binding protein
LIAVDSSIAVAAFAPWHELHLRALDALDERPALPTRAALEAYSVLTRLPQPGRASGEVAARFLAERFREPWLTLPGAHQREMLQELGRQGIVGGAMHDAFVAATARHHELVLVTADRRAASTYARVGVSVRMVGSDALL